MEPSLGDEIREARSEARLRVSDLARLTRSSSGYVSEIENGRRVLPLGKVARFCEVLDLDPHRIAVLAAIQRGRIELDAKRVSERARQVGALLALKWTHLSPAQLEGIENVLTLRDRRADIDLLTAKVEDLRGTLDRFLDEFRPLNPMDAPAGSDDDRAAEENRDSGDPWF